MANSDIRPWRLRALLARLEDVEGTENTPDPTTHAIQLIGGEGQLESQRLEREIDRPHFTGLPYVRTQRRASISGQVELLGASTVGEPAPIDAILQAAGHAMTTVEDAGTPVATEYNPVSEGIPSLTAWWFHGGERMRGLGCRVALERIEAAINGYALARVQIQGSPQPIGEADLPTAVDYSAYQEPVAISTESLTVELNGKKLDAISLQHDNNPQLQMVEHSEGRSTRLTDRRASGTLRIYRPMVSHIDLRALVESHARVPLALTIQGGAGRSVGLDLSSIQLGDPQRTEVDGLVAWDVPYVAIADQGHDEYIIRFN